MDNSGIMSIKTTKDLIDFERTKKLADELKTLSMKVHVGNNTIQYAGELVSMLEQLPVIYKNVKEIEEKVSHYNKRKKEEDE